jgi:hypothetical protein
MVSRTSGLTFCRAVPSKPNRRWATCDLGGLHDRGCGGARSGSVGAVGRSHRPALAPPSRAEMRQPKVPPPREQQITISAWRKVNANVSDLWTLTAIGSLFAIVFILTCLQSDYRAGRLASTAPSLSRPRQRSAIRQDGPAAPLRLRGIALQANGWLPASGSELDRDESPRLNPKSQYLFGRRTEKIIEQGVRHSHSLCTTVQPEGLSHGW